MSSNRPSEASVTWPTRTQHKVLDATAVGVPIKPDWPSEESYARGAKTLHCEVSALKTIANVEGGIYGAFLDVEGQPPTILYERHIFHRLTNGKFDGQRDTEFPRLHDAVSLLSSAKRGGYGPVSIQHRKLQAAVRLDRTAALMSASWGLFQILGLNYERAGHRTLQSFINAMYRSVDDHLEALVHFIQSDSVLLRAIQTKDWRRFKVRYNGPAENGYEKRMAAEYKRLTAKS